MPAQASLLEIDPELAADLSAGARRRAAAELRIPVVTLPKGRWVPPSRIREPGALGLLILRGLMLRRVAVHGSPAVEPLGPGDLIRPWQEEVASSASVRWSVARPTDLGVLDVRFVRLLARWPSVIRTLIERSVARSRRMASGAAISNMVGVEKRVLAALWHLADKWGHADDGLVVIPVRIGHATIAEIVGARRPTVTKALGTLVERGEVIRVSGGRWAVRGPVPTRR